jgi:UDP-N-acetyl-D-glucosamine dehydrogenase
MKIGVVGQGYVGLPLSMACVDAGMDVIGFDKNESKVANLNSGISEVEDIANLKLSKALATGRYKASKEIKLSDDIEIITICVPTPLGNDHKPDLKILESATESVAKELKVGMLVIVESTIQPGTTRNVVVPILEKFSGLSRSDFFVAFSPERIDPMNETWNIRNTPKLVAGLTPAAASKAQDFYSKFIENIEICDSLEVAETAKLLENSFRLVNISFINELGMFCQKIGIDINDVVKAASTKPYGFMPFYPSVGVGGHCIPVDPLYLAEAAKEAGSPMQFIDLADKINLEMPKYYVSRATEIIGALKEKKILVIGVAYKPDVADIRETPVESLLQELRKSGSKVSWHDELVKEWNNEKSVDISDQYDLAILATPHSNINLKLLGKVPLLNTRGTGSAHNSDKAHK